MYSDGVKGSVTRGRGVTPYLSDRQITDLTRFVINPFYALWQISIANYLWFFLFNKQLVGLLPVA